MEGDRVRRREFITLAGAAVAKARDRAGVASRDSDCRFPQWRFGCNGYLYHAS